MRTTKNLTIATHVQRKRWTFHGLVTEPFIPLLVLSLQIYVVENNLEIYGRDLLLLSIALEPKDRLGLQGEPFDMIHQQDNILSPL